MINFSYSAIFHLSMKSIIERKIFNLLFVINSEIKKKLFFSELLKELIRLLNIVLNGGLSLKLLSICHFLINLKKGKLLHFFTEIYNSIEIFI